MGLNPLNVQNYMETLLQYCICRADTEKKVLFIYLSILTIVPLLAQLEVGLVLFVYSVLFKVHLMFTLYFLSNSTHVSSVYVKKDIPITSFAHECEICSLSLATVA